jgi:hypothetical protein
MNRYELITICILQRLTKRMVAHLAQLKFCSALELYDWSVNDDQIV